LKSHLRMAFFVFNYFMEIIKYINKIK